MSSLKDFFSKKSSKKVKVYMQTIKASDNHSFLFCGSIGDKMLVIVTNEVTIILLLSSLY